MTEIEREFEMTEEELAEVIEQLPKILEELEMTFMQGKVNNS